MSQLGPVRGSSERCRAEVFTMDKTQNSHWRNLGKAASLTARNPARFIVQHIAPLLYGWAKKRPGTSPRDKAFSSDQQFWHAAPALPFSTVDLQHFRLLDWFPRAPGVYHSSQAVKVRKSRDWRRSVPCKPLILYWCGAPDLTKNSSRYLRA